MRVEFGEMSQAEFDELETNILTRLREIRERQRGGEGASLSPSDYKIIGVEASFDGDEHR